jgi:CheY-like chemotaxis protein
MNKRGPVIIVEDDDDDQFFLTQAFKHLNYENEIIFFSDAEEALEYLTITDSEPFVILSDVNMPKLSGLELRQKVHENEDLRLKYIPYLFLTTTAEQKHVIAAYSKSIQGFFIKPNSATELEKLIRHIMEYWQDCVSPDYVK